MQRYHLDDLEVFLNKKGVDRYDKVSYPIRYGSYAEIRSERFIYQFNLNGEIKHILGRDPLLMEPSEWLKRTVGNDWVYYSSGGYNGAFSATGEHYIPCFTYPSNSILGGRPFKTGVLDSALLSFEKILDKINKVQSCGHDRELSDFLSSVTENNLSALNRRSEAFHSITGGRISVLPPDTRHVDYDVIPVGISHGCIYNCRFCRVKSGRRFGTRSHKDIEDQILKLKSFYGNDMVNYNSVFLGEHDALNAGRDLIAFAALKAYEVFQFNLSIIREPKLFLFGSADSFLNSPESLFTMLNRLPYQTFINIGLESADDKTLSMLGKPLSAETVCSAFYKMVDVNRSFPKIEITANFVYGDGLPESHLSSFLELTGKGPGRSCSGGALYLSPMETVKNRKALVSKFKILKNQCSLPLFLYIIQRL